jgi:hypothetical protein
MLPPSRRLDQNPRSTVNSAGPTMKYPSENQSQEVLAGLVERVTYHNVENGFCVLRAKARGHRDVVTVVGHAAILPPVSGSRRQANGSTIAPTASSSRRGSCAHRPDLGRRYREVPLVRHDPGHRPGLRQEAPARLMSSHRGAVSVVRLTEVVLVQKKAVAIAVRNVSGRRRWSKLAEWLSADTSRSVT